MVSGTIAGTKVQNAVRKFMALLQFHSMSDWTTDPRALKCTLLGNTCSEILMDFPGNTFSNRHTNSHSNSTYRTTYATTASIRHNSDVVQIKKS